MNEQRLRALLREAPVPEAAEAERRGLMVVSAAYAERESRQPPRLPRLALAFAIATLLAAILLTPAWAAMRDWIGDVLTAGVRNPEPALTEVPGGGHLLVVNPQGAWVVQPDGSRRLLGRYREAAWSPHGLYVAAAEGRTLSAIEPGGAANWVLSTKGAVSDPRWSPSGVRIAYRAGRSLRVVVGDGTKDSLLARAVAPIPPVWSPLGLHLLAYIDAGRRLRIVNTDTRERLAAAAVPAGVEELGWAPGGALLLVARPRSLQVRSVTTDKLANRLALGPTRSLPLPSGEIVRQAAFSPRGETIAALLERPGRGSRPPRSTLALIDPSRGTSRTLFAVPGRLAELTWSPDGGRLLIGWPEADEWLFIPTRGRERPRAIAPISREFAPGAAGAAGFPHVAGWCCGVQIGSPGAP
jgi:dipeptidyl aminopeptidase/acylaminoacyl peptidase